MRHVIWDWNGTLLADFEITVAAVNDVMDRLGVGPCTPDDYRNHYTRPVKLFYERLAGRPIPEGEWKALDGVWHEAYLARLDDASLTSDAVEALERVTAAGGTQSLLSMWHHEQLEPLVDRLGLAGHFVRVDGLRGAGGGRKLPHLQAHLRALRADPAARADEAVMIGDALDDAYAAHDAGLSCVLYDGGSHQRSELDEAGSPVADTLLHALDLIDEHAFGAG